jgi:fatty-acid desaturase
MWHQLGQALFFLAWGGLPFFVWGFVIRILLTMHATCEWAQRASWLGHELRAGH